MRATIGIAEVDKKIFNSVLTISISLIVIRKKHGTYDSLETI